MEENQYYKINITWVIEALKWLQQNNPYYKHIEIDKKRYSYLPENTDVTINKLKAGLVFFDRDPLRDNQNEETSKINTEATERAD